LIRILIDLGFEGRDDPPNVVFRSPAEPNAIPAASYSGWYQPAPMPSSNRPPEIK
jgi:hypothetical protein